MDYIKGNEDVTCIIMTHSLYVTLSINDTEHDNAQHNALGHYAECHALFIEILSASMLNVLMLSAVILNVAMLSVMAPNGAVFVYKYCSLQPLPLCCN